MPTKPTHILLNEKNLNVTGLCTSQPVFIHTKLTKANYYGNCTCGEGAEVVNGVCGCPAGLILDDSGTICYNGINSTFDQTQEGFLSIKIGTPFTERLS